MAQKISVAARQELVQAIGESYRAGSREEKLRILDGGWSSSSAIPPAGW